MLVSILINLFVICIFISLYLIFKRSDKKISRMDEYLGKVSNMVNSVRYGNLATKIERLELSNYKNLSESINRMVETLNDREKMIVEYQNELTRQNNFLEAIINSLSDGILIIDENGKILRVTPQIVNWFGKDTKEIISKNLSDFIVFDEDKKCYELSEDEICIKNNTAASFEASAGRLVLDDKKKRYVVIIKDITSHRELERLREDFVATLTHDLKVPIVAESNILEFLISGKFGEINEKQYEAVSNMKNCNQELLELVQVLLETYKVKETGIELELVELDLTSFVRNIVDDMQPIANKNGIGINIDFDSEFKFKADRMHLKRVIKNLIQNAISHSESNKDVEVKIENGETEHGDNLIKIRIIDYGKGIPKEEIDKIFEKYYSTARKFRKIGTGLGLYLSQQIIKAHGGEILVKSEENKSTEFCINLPV